MTDLVTLAIDGKEVTVPKGTLIIRAAEELGIEIPRFCDHPLLDPVAACRQCYVKVEGQRKLMTSCSTPVADGMKVFTQYTDDEVHKAQVGVLEFADDVGVQGARVRQALHRERVLGHARQAEEVGHAADRQHQVIEPDRKEGAGAAVTRDHRAPLQIDLLDLGLSDHRPPQKGAERRDDMLRLDRSGRQGPSPNRGHYDRDRVDSGTGTELNSRARRARGCGAP